MGGRQAVLGLDLGTTIVKAVILDGDGTVLASGASQRLHTSSPLPNRAEQDPAQVWTAVTEAIRAAIGAVDGSVTLLGVSLAAQSGSLVWLEDDGEPLGPLITWMDTRAAEQVRRWERDGTADRIRIITGWTTTAGLGLPLIAWLAGQSELSAMQRLGGAETLIVHRLTGEWMTNPSNAAGLQLMDLRTTHWSNELCDLVGIDAASLPSIAAAGAQIGTVTDSAARDCGLPSGLPVFSGGHDQACTALGVGLTDPGEVLLAGGTAWVLTTVAGSPGTINPREDVNVSHHIVPGRWTRSMLLGGLGAHIEELLAANATDPTVPDLRAEQLRNLDLEVGSSSTAVNAPFFVPGSFRNASGQEISSLGRGDKARAIMEYAGFRLSATLDRNGTTPATVTLVGGVNDSPHWPRVLADTTGSIMVVSRSPSWPATGSAVLAGVGAGLFNSLETGITRLHQDQTRVEPDPESVDRYRTRADTHRRLMKEAQK